MGTAIISELPKPAFSASFLVSLVSGKDPLENVYQGVERLLMKNDFLKVHHGCPVANLTQEMTPWHEAFSKALNEITQQWLTAMTTVIAYKPGCNPAELCGIK